MQYAVRRYLNDVETAERRGWWFDDDAANREIAFFETCLTHTTGEYNGDEFLLRLFQKFIVWNLFGWKRLSADGEERRRFRKAFISMARGNGKSPLGAGILNSLAWADQPIVPRAQCYTFATKEDQAKIAWEECRCQVEASRSQMLKRSVQRMTKNMHNLATGAKLEPKGSDSKSSDGWIIHGAIIDELHAWSDWHRGLKDKIETALKGNQPLLIIVTTAGDETSKLWVEEYDYSVLVVTPGTGVEDDDLFVFVAEIDASKTCESCGGSGCGECEQSGLVSLDPLDESLWPQANPMLAEPRSPIKLDALRSMARKARTKPEVLNTFRRYHANQKVTSTFRLITPELWSMGNRPLPDTKGLECCLGMDWGWKDDLAALAAVFPVGDDYAIQLWAWIPSEGPRNLAEQPWSQWIEQGWLRVTDGNMTDPNAIYDVIDTEILPHHAVISAAFDQHAAMEFGVRCQEWGIKEWAFTQSPMKYNEPTRELKRLLTEGHVIHGGNPVLSWAASNLIVQTDHRGYIMPSKLKSTEKIDPMTATIMAFSETKYRPKEEPVEGGCFIL